MVTNRKCSFCGKEIEVGTGLMVVAYSGAVSTYCCSKCEKNAKLGRSARKVKWTEDYRKEKAVRVKGLQTAAPTEKPKEEAEEKKAKAPKEKTATVEEKKPEEKKEPKKKKAAAKAKKK